MTELQPAVEKISGDVADVGCGQVVLARAGIVSGDAYVDGRGAMGGSSWASR